MVEWKTLFDGEVSGHPVFVAMHKDENALVRIKTAPIDNKLGYIKDIEPGLAIGNASEFEVGPTMFESDVSNDLLEQLWEAGLSDQQVDEIVGYLPE
jgi:hypothetical protein